MLRENDQSFKSRVLLLTGIIVVLWFVRAIDTFLPYGFSAAGNGIVPRTWDGLWAIPVSPLIHGSWGHLISNTIPLIVLGVIVLFRGTTEFLFVLLVTILVAGLGIWLFAAPNTQHVGASSVVFGLFGYLVFRSAFDRKITSAVITLAVAVVYGGSMVVGLLPEQHVSWTGHFFGFLGGFLAARIRYPHRRLRVAQSSWH